MHQFLDKVSNEKHPGHHQHQWKDIRDGLQVPGEYRRSNCQHCCKKTSNVQCHQWQRKRTIMESSVWWGGEGDNCVQKLLMPINPSWFYYISFLLICKVWWSRIFQLFFSFFFNKPIFHSNDIMHWILGNAAAQTFSLQFGVIDWKQCCILVDQIYIISCRDAWSSLWMLLKLSLRVCICTVTVSIQSYSAEPKWITSRLSVPFHKLIISESAKFYCLIFPSLWDNVCPFMFTGMYAY